MKPLHRVIVFLFICFVVFSGLLGVSNSVAQPADIPALMSPNGGKGPIITTHGSVWFFSDDVWRYPAFRDFEDSFDFINTLEIDEVLEEHSGLTLEPYQSMELSFALSQEVDDALIFDLTGTTPGYEGLRWTARRGNNGNGHFFSSFSTFS